MTHANGSFSVILSQLLYTLPILLVSIAAVIVCVMNWQKAPTAAMFCLIGFSLIGFNSVFGGFLTFLMIYNGANSVTLREFSSLMGALRVIIGATGYVFLLIAVFHGRTGEVRPNVFESPPAQPGTPQ